MSVLLIFYLGLNLDLITQEPVPENITPSCKLLWVCLIGWNFKLKKQTSQGNFEKVFGWCDTTEKQVRFTLHSHILLFIAMFDALVTLVWSNCEKVREEAQKELVEFLKKNYEFNL
jgi:hypothetical protein